MERLFQAGFDFVPQNIAYARVMFNAVYGPDEEFKAYVFNAYQPMFNFVAVEIIAPGVAGGIFREVDPAEMALLLMTIYLGTASHVDHQGHTWLNPASVARLALNGLQT